MFFLFCQIPNNSSKILFSLAIALVFIITPIVTFIPIHNGFSFGLFYGKSASLSRRNSLTSVLQEIPKEGGFDSEFADAISKPLPEWYLLEKQKKEAFMKEVEENRQRIIQEFKAKYDVTEAVKAQEIKEKWDRIEARSKKSSESSTGNWLKNIFGSKETTTIDTDAKPTSREAWEKIWKDDEKEPDFYLPGFFEVFPELKLKWPNFSRNKNGKRFKCKVDSDCPFPQACCMHPILSDEKFCCTGWGRRAMVPQYCPQELVSNQMNRQEKEQAPNQDKLW